MLVVYGLWQVFRWGGHQHQALIGDLAFFPVNGAAALWAWRVSRRQDLGRATCRAWRLLSVAFWLYLLGDAVQLIYEVILHQKGDPSWADAAYLSFYPVAFAGLLAFPSPRRTMSQQFRLLLDVGTVFVGGATVIWYTSLGPAVASARGFELANLVLFAYPVGDLLLLFGVLSLLWRGAPRSSVASLRIFATGMLMFIVADVVYDYVSTHASYLGGDPVDTLWMVALAILFVAAACQLRARPAGRIRRAAAAPHLGPQHSALSGRRRQLHPAHDRRPEERHLQFRGRRSPWRGRADRAGQCAPVRRPARQQPAHGQVRRTRFNRRDDRSVQPAPSHGGGGERFGPCAAARPAARRPVDRRGPLQADQRRIRPCRRRPRPG